MRNKIKFKQILVSSVLLYSCTSTKNISKYYFKNQKSLDSIQQFYKQLYHQKPFSIEFTDKSFNNVSLEIFTDTFKYVYEFGINEKRMEDTLQKYQFPAMGIKKLLSQMQLIHCTWINTLDYYVDRKKNFLVFMSIRPTLLTTPFTNKKYYIITYFQQPQYYDDEGILLNNRKRKNIRKINNDIFRRITDKVAYTISDRFR